MANARTTQLTIAIFGTGIVFCLAFGLLLGHRTDYVGHFAAGYGGTLGLLTLVVASSAARLTPAALHARVLIVTIVCIGLGTFTEATIFRLAQFDVVDFCNQSIGAVLAALAFVAARPETPLSLGSLAAGFIASFLFLVAGFILAFA